jgi:ankyrin repeat protein
MNIVHAIKNNETERALKLLDLLQEQNLDANIIEPNLYIDCNFYNILQLACLDDLTEVALKILDIGCDINYQDKNYKDTALHMAVFNCEKVVSKILDSGCDVNIQNNLGLTALHYACSYRMINMIKLLLSTNKCNLELRDISNKTCFDLLRDEIGFLKKIEFNNLKIEERFMYNQLKNVIYDFYNKKAKELDNIVSKYFLLENKLMYKIVEFIY